MLVLQLKWTVYHLTDFRDDWTRWGWARRGGGLGPARFREGQKRLGERRKGKIWSNIFPEGGGEAEEGD